jgi:hypothetical protein
MLYVDCYGIILFWRNKCIYGALGSVPGWDSMLKVWKSLVRFQMLLFFFQLTESFQPHYGPGLDSASNRNEYQETSWG